MGSPRTKRGEESRSRLLDAAAAEFARVGYHAAKVSDIVAAAGLTQAAFYLYFPSKEAIYGELVTDFRTRLQALADAGRLVTSPSPGAVRHQVRANLVALFHFLMADPDRTTVAAIQDPNREETIHEVSERIRTNLRANQATGIVRADLDDSLVAEAMLGLVERLLLRWLKTREGDAESLANATADMLLDGILNRDAGRNGMC